eukprot:766694-Amorphochlora_amoeboformis.AAC.1
MFYNNLEGSHFTTTGIVNKINGEVTTTSPVITGLRVNGFVTSDVDITLNGQVYTSDYASLLLKEFVFHDEPVIRRYSPKEGEQMGTI